MAEPTLPLPPEPAPRPVLRLKSQKFREAREGDWRALSAALDKVEKKGLGGFSIDEILDLPLLYRQAVSSLSMAQSISLDRNMITYLQALCVRAYVYIYGPQTRLKDVFQGFFGRAWPKGVRALWPELVLSLVVSVIGVLVGWLFCAHDATWYDMFIPPDLSEGRDVAASVSDLRATLGHGILHRHELPSMAAMLMTHNTQVCIGAFAFGAIFGLPTILSLIQNGYVLGAMLWLFYQKGLGFEFSAWLMIHGTTELTAIVISGACGFHIGRKLMFPGEQTRRQALSDAGQLTGTVMIGVALMLMVAGCLEGIGRQTILDPLARMATGGVMFALWAAYFLFAGRKAGTNHGGR